MAGDYTKKQEAWRVAIPPLLRQLVLIRRKYDDAPGKKEFEDCAQMTKITAADECDILGEEPPKWAI